MSASSLREALLAALPPGAGETFRDIGEELDRALETFVASATQDANYGVRPQDFLAHVAGKLADDATLEQLAKLRAFDLYLAFACSRGETRALERFDAEFGRDIDLAISRSGSSDIGTDEFRQQVRDKLFVVRGDRPAKIADYAGRGDLRSWVRVTALRMVVDIVRQRAGDREVPVEADFLSAVPSPGRDPELDYIQRVYKDQFKDALQAGFNALNARERNLLRHQVLHGLNIDQVGALYNVHRTTAFRWIEKARKALLKETRRALMSRLRVGSSEFLSIMRVVQGDLDVSVRRMLVADLEDEV